MTLILQHAFVSAKNIANPSATGAVLCGQKQMLEVGIYVILRSFCISLSLFVFCAEKIVFST
jgi:hypothetical protein